MNVVQGIAFEPLHDGLRGEVDNYLASYQGPLMDFSFANLVTLQIRGRMRVHRASGELYFIRSAGGRHDLMLPPVAAPDPARFDYGFDLLDRLNGEPSGRVLNVPPALAASLDPGRHAVLDDRPDYLYRAAELASLDGPAFRMRRKDTNRFIKNWPDAATVPLDAGTLPAARAFAADLFSRKDRDHPRVRSPFRFDLPDPATAYYWDKYATRRLLAGFDRGGTDGPAGPRGLVLLVAGRVAGFAIGALRARVLVILSGKVRDGFEGGLTLLLQRLVAGWPAPLDLVNLADDGGLSGLRRMKENLKPAGLAERRTVLRTGRRPA